MLSKNGENWLLPRLARYKGNFRVYEILQKVPPDVDEEDIIAYSASRNPEIDVNSITHFAAGIFWKASVHSWRKGISKPKIDLGKYSDQLREFVYGVAPFPRETVLRVAVNPPEKRSLILSIPIVAKPRITRTSYFLFLECSSFWESKRV